MSAGMQQTASPFDVYSKELHMVLEDPKKAPVTVSLDYLKATTEGFSRQRLIGEGGFGKVYKGDLGRGKFMAVKKLINLVVDDDRSYTSELKNLLNIPRHRNIVQLIGYCGETKMQAITQHGEHIVADVRDRLLCFEYISNGSLRDYVPDFQIFNNKDDQHCLGWDMRYTIMEGICTGLNFLHENCRLTHMDLKPENILMDDDMVPKITDFGLCRPRPKDAAKSNFFTQRLSGTFGYMPPEFLLEGEGSPKTDVYSLGVIMCEIITGKKGDFRYGATKAKQFKDRACEKWLEIFENTLNDASLKEIYIKQVQQLLEIVQKCLDEDRKKRPSSSEILQVFIPNPAQRKGMYNTAPPFPEYSKQKQLQMVLEDPSEYSKQQSQMVLEDPSEFNKQKQPQMVLEDPSEYSKQKQPQMVLEDPSVSSKQKQPQMVLEDPSEYRMYSSTSTFDEVNKSLQMVLDDPSHEAPVRVSLDYLKAITNDFSSERLIGRGGFGEVYKGVIGRDKSIAIKKLYAKNVVDDRKYHAELDSLLRIRHQNIVQLIGYCAETKLEAARYNEKNVLAEVRERLLCFEYISNGSLGGVIPKLQIFKNEDQDLFSWDTRYKIMEGICRGLDFLHEECKLTHMDLKPENILLDNDMVPKITDFAMSRLWHAEDSIMVTRTLIGTLGYMAPEFLLEGQISLKTDIYSLGVLTCEIITGEKRGAVDLSIEFIERACGRWMEIFEKSLNDASLKEIYIKQVKQLLDISQKCVDRDREKRPSLSEILGAVFNQNPAEQSSCELNSKYGQAIKLLSVHPPQLDFCLTESSEKLHRSSPCLLHLTNNMDNPVAFRLQPSDTLAEHFWPQSGVVPPKCSRYSLAVIMRPQRNATFVIDGFFTLQSTKARIVQGLLSENEPEEIFKRAREMGFMVHEAKLAFACAHTEDGQDIKPGLMILPFEMPEYTTLVRGLDTPVHPTEPWIFTNVIDDTYKFAVWDYNRLEKVRFHGANISYDDADGHLLLPGIPKFISQKRWILVGSRGYINVYSYMTVRNFKRSKTCLVSKIKSFKAHDSGDLRLDVHPSRTYVLSLPVIISAHDESEKLKPVDSIKLWDWENGWNCVKTFNMDEEEVARGPQFNPKEQDTFITISGKGVVKVWNIDSPECKYTFPTTDRRPSCFDFFTQGGKQYLIIVDEDDKCTIWDYHSGTLIEVLKGRIYNACSHPELPVIITGTANKGNNGPDGSEIRLFSGTFSLLGVLNCGLGAVKVASGVKGSRRIVIQHKYGIAVAEIGHMLESERPHELEKRENGDR